MANVKERCFLDVQNIRHWQSVYYFPVSVLSFEIDLMAYLRKWKSPWCISLEIVKSVLKLIKLSSNDSSVYFHAICAFLLSTVFLCRCCLFIFNTPLQCFCLLSLQFIPTFIQRIQRSHMWKAIVVSYSGMCFFRSQILSDHLSNIQCVHLALVLFLYQLCIHCWQIAITAIA